MSEDIINFYEVIPEKFLLKVKNPYENEHKISLPLLAACVAGSGAGKTNWLLNFLEVMHDYQTFDRIVILCKNKDEPLYNALSEGLPDIEFHEIRSEKVKGKGTVLIGLPELDKFKKEQNTLIVFDDLVGEKNQEGIEQFYLRARKKNISCLYLSQSYFKMPKFVRLQLHMLFLLKLSSDKDLNLVLNEYAIGINKEELLAIYKYATREKFHFLTIHISAPLEKRYRLNFKTIVDISHNNSEEIFENN